MSLRRLIGIMFASASLSASLFVPSESHGDEPPNIVFVLADDVGVEPLGCYGGTSFKTPQIDRLAAAGMRFDHCYSMPVCHPSRICFLTGRYPSRIGSPAWGSFPVEWENHTVAQRLRSAGYATAVAGKWQLTRLADDPQHPHRLGFDEYCLFGWHEGARYHDPLIWQNGRQLGSTQGQFGPDIYLDFLADFIKAHRRDRFFVVYSMALCHDVTDDLRQPVPYPPGMDRYLSFGEMVRHMDDQVGRLVQVLDDLELSRRTLIVFTGDNGTPQRSIVRAEPTRTGWKFIREPVECEFRGRRVAGGKGTLTDRGTHVPLIACWPGRIPAGRNVDDLVDFSDFLPTFVELANATISPEYPTDGLSFARRLTANQPGPRRWAYAEHRGDAWVRTQRWKLTRHGEFFDLRSDPDESTNLASEELSPEAQPAYRLLQQAMATR